MQPLVQHRPFVCSSYFSFTAMYSAVVLLLSYPAEFSVAYFQHFMYYYPDKVTKQHFTCHAHYYGKVWNSFVKKSVDLKHAGWCLSVLWTAIAESN